MPTQTRSSASVLMLNAIADSIAALRSDVTALRTAQQCFQHTVSAQLDGFKKQLDEFKEHEQQKHQNMCNQCGKFSTDYNVRDCDGGMYCDECRHDMSCNW